MNSITKIGKTALTQALSQKPIDFPVLRQRTYLEFSEEKIEVEFETHDLGKNPPAVKNEDGSYTKTWTTYSMWSIRLGLRDLNTSKIIQDEILKIIKKMNSDLDSSFEIPTHIIKKYVVQRRRNLDVPHQKGESDRNKDVYYTIYRLTEKQRDLIKEKYSEFELESLRKKEGGK